MIHLSRLVKWKKVDLLINAFAEIKKEYKDAELLIIGEGAEKENLIKQTKDLCLETSVKFLGAIYDIEILGKYIMSSTVYVLAGMGGLSINDAMIFGLPIICSVCDGTEKKLVRDGYNGLFFKEDDLHDLVSKIKYIFDNPNEAKQMGLNSVKIIEKEVNIHIVINRYLDAFRYVLQQNN
jgi:glycosyltransferase involved in cell wall biosynthesis